MSEASESSLMASSIFRAARIDSEAALREAGLDVLLCCARVAEAGSWHPAAPDALACRQQLRRPAGISREDAGGGPVSRHRGVGAVKVGDIQGMASECRSSAYVSIAASFGRDVTVGSGCALMAAIGMELDSSSTGGNRRRCSLASSGLTP